MREHARKARAKYGIVIFTWKDGRGLGEIDERIGWMLPASRECRDWKAMVLLQGLSCKLVTRSLWSRCKRLNLAMMYVT